MTESTDITSASQIGELERVITYMYEAGDLPDDVSKWAEEFVTPDGGTWNLLDNVKRLHELAYRYQRPGYEPETYQEMARNLMCANMDVLDRLTSAEAEIAEDAGVMNALRRQRDSAESKVARVDGLHQQYLPAAVEFDCCSHCNAISGGYIAWPCPTMKALEGLL